MSRPYRLTLLNLEMDPKGDRVEVNFESHPPIEEDLDGLTALLRQTLLQYADCNALAQYLIELKEVTQVIALEASDEGNTSEEDEPDDNIYGVASVIDLQADKTSSESRAEALKQLTKFLKDKCPELKKLLETPGETVKTGLIVNERYVNLPPQLALPFLSRLTQYLEESHYSYLIFVSKILLRSRNVDTKLPSKKTKLAGESSKTKENSAEPIIYVNPEEEIVFENSDYHADLDVSSHCDGNATWSLSSDIKYIPYRRIMVVDYKKWPILLKSLEKELS